MRKKTRRPTSKTRRTKKTRAREPLKKTRVRKRSKKAAARRTKKTTRGPRATRTTPGPARLGVAEVAALRTPADTAKLIQTNASITLANRHPSGQVDDAHAKQNIADTAAVLPAKRSSYDGAPGGTVPLGAALLDGMLAFAGDFSFRVSEIAGGSHSPTARHYVGLAFDIDQLNGNAVNADNPDVSSVKQSLRSFGATEVLGPGDPGHNTHVHGAWPRP